VAVKWREAASTDLETHFRETRYPIFRYWAGKSVFLSWHISK